MEVSNSGPNGSPPAAPRFIYSAEKCATVIDYTFSGRMRARFTTREASSTDLPEVEQIMDGVRREVPHPQGGDGKVGDQLDRVGVAGDFDELAELVVDFQSREHSTKLVESRFVRQFLKSPVARFTDKSA